MKMSSKDVAESFAIGAGAYIMLWVCLAFAPSLMVSLSITDFFFDWDETVTEHVKIPDIFPKDEFPHMWEDADENGYVIHQVPKDSFADACFWFCIIFIILGFIQSALVANIQNTWGIVVPWFLLSIHPFICWVLWMGGPSDVPFPGINWMPW
jgi:hypothetical protein